MLVLGIECPGFEVDEESGDGALCAAHGTRFTAAPYDLRTGDWKVVPSPPGLPAPARHDPDATRLTWVPSVIGVSERGDIVVNLGETGPTPSYWAFTPATAQWHQLERAPLTASMCTTGNQLVALTTKFDFDDGREIVDDDPFLDPKPDGLSLGPNAGSVEPTLRFLDLAAPDAGWQLSPTLTGVTYSYAMEPGIVCLGARVMVIGATREPNGRLKVYDTESRTWSTPSAPPSPPAGQIDATVLSRHVWTGTELLFLNPAPERAGGTSTPLSKPLPGVVYSPATNRWRRIPSFGVPPSQPQWTGTSVVDFNAPFVVHTTLR